MNKIICSLVTASVLVGGAAYGQSTSKTTQKQPMRDSQMDKVTAGQSEGGDASGGSIAANNSAVNTTTTGSVNLSGTALMGASGLNIVRSTDSLVANGVNVYDSSLTADNANDGSKVNQSNSIDQSQSTGATLDSYHRGQNSQLTVNKTQTIRG